MNFPKDENVHITLLNLEKVPVKNIKLDSAKGDATNLLAYEDKQFDIVFSNSVIEHLFTKENQKKMADEVRKGRQKLLRADAELLFSNRTTLLFPFFQFLPFNIKVFLTRNFDMGHYKKAVSKAAAIDKVKEVKLLTEKELKGLFPEGKVYREKFMGLKKSMAIYHFFEP